MNITKIANAIFTQFLEREGFSAEFSDAEFLLIDSCKSLDEYKSIRRIGLQAITRNTRISLFHSYQNAYNHAHVTCDAVYNGEF